MLTEGLRSNDDSMERRYFAEAVQQLVALPAGLTAVLASVLFGDPLTWLMSLGIVVVVAGVFLVEFGAGAARTVPRRAASDPEDAQ